MSQSTLIRVTPVLFINWFTIESVEVITPGPSLAAARMQLFSDTPQPSPPLVPPEDAPFVRVRAGGRGHDIPLADGGARLLTYLQSISEDLTAPPSEVATTPTEEAHGRSFADRFVRPIADAS